MRTRRLALAALAALTAVLSTGCRPGRTAGHPPVTPSARGTAGTPDTAPRRLTAVLVSARTAAGATRVTYRPATVRHRRDGYSEWNEVRPSGPPVSAALDAAARVLLCTPLNERAGGGVTRPEPVAHETFVAALAKNRPLLPRIGFEMRIAATGRIVYLKEIYQP